MKYQNLLIILPNSRGFYALVSLLSVGLVAIVCVSVLAIAALAGVTVFVAILGYHLLIAVSGMAIQAGPLTQVLLVLVCSWFLAKIYPAIGRGVCVAVSLCKGGN